MSLETSPVVISIVYQCAEVEMVKYGDTDVQRYIQQQARTCRDMIGGKVVRKWRLEKLQSFCERISKVSLQMTYNMQPPCVVTSL